MKGQQLPKGFSYVAAGMLKHRFAGYCVYIKYRKGASAIKVIYRDRHSIMFSCPDRELFIVRQSYDCFVAHPFAAGYDECIDLDVYHDAVSKALGIDYIMTNYAHDSRNTTLRTTSTLEPSSRIQVLSDSGGLQLYRGQTDIIHPKALVNYYNTNVDAGMVLDLPPVYESKTVSLERLAILQKRNNDVMLEHAKGIELINIFHGMTTEERRFYRSIVDDPRINRVAIASINVDRVVWSVDSVYDYILNSDYKQYHILGVFKAHLIPLFIRMANTGKKPHITVDSSSHVQSAICRAYHIQFGSESISRRLSMGKLDSPENSRKLLPCQCYVCTALKYNDILGIGPEPYSSRLLSVHNAYEMARYCHQLQEYHNNLPLEEYKKIVYRQLSDHPKLLEVKQGFDYIDILLDKGLKAARRKYKNLISYSTEERDRKYADKGSLFGDVKTQESNTIFENLVIRMENQL